MYDLISIGDTQNDTFLQLNDKEAHVMCKLNTQDCEICFNYADKIPVESVYRCVAGNAANVAVSGARMGLTVGLWSLLGDDMLGREDLEKFKEEGVGVELVTTQKGTSSNVSTVINIFGERTILVYHYPRTYELPVLPKAQYYYLTSMAPGSESIFDSLVKILAADGSKLVYQPGTYQLRIGPKPADQLLKQTEIIFMNVQEAQKYTGENSSDIKVLLKALKNLGPKIAVITDGTKGSYCHDGSQMLFMDIIKEIPRIEATGAGDAYAAGFTIARIAGKSIEQAMAWGNYNASGVIQKIGPQAGLIRKEDVNIWEQKYPLTTTEL